MKQRLLAGLLAVVLVLGLAPAALAAATSSALPLAISSRNWRVVAPPKLWPTRLTARFVPQPEKSG